MQNITSISTEQLNNPITGKPVDEIIKEVEAKERGYLELEFILKYLEDENESIKYFEVDGKRIVVQLARPKYRKTQINHERVLNDIKEVAPVCAIDDSECLSCGS